MRVLEQLFEAGGEVLVYALVLGAGLPTIFAIGIWALSFGAKGVDDVAEHHPHPIAKVFAGVCFAVVILAIAAGITIIVGHGFGMTLQFGWPLLVAK
ncbi:hypothetical protein [Propionimicrobium sp. PCR01-08-3]|uniref:hypothetical protein n=1 Tax=Propionimicrobium sp. PCR01-08-3 TaxID=3052086 RepID=UPI00255D15FB|nr:hypothetical protein [Propionimicrobium sp. PCR01-08-3]WIY81663.1 hypothetical protein QQ658_09000 [Propionimicrobium sp. PCR01-08-3]